MAASVDSKVEDDYVVHETIRLRWKKVGFRWRLQWRKSTGEGRDWAQQGPQFRVITNVPGSFFAICFIIQSITWHPFISFIVVLSFRVLFLFSALHYLISRFCFNIFFFSKQVIFSQHNTYISKTPYGKKFKDQIVLQMLNFFALRVSNTSIVYL